MAVLKYYICFSTLFFFYADCWYSKYNRLVRNSSKPVLENAVKSDPTVYLALLLQNSINDVE